MFMTFTSGRGFTLPRAPGILNPTERSPAQYERQYPFRMPVFTFDVLILAFTAVLFCIRRIDILHNGIHGKCCHKEVWKSTSFRAYLEITVHLGGHPFSILSHLPPLSPFQNANSSSVIPSALLSLLSFSLCRCPHRSQSQGFFCVPCSFVHTKPSGHPA